MVITVNVPEAQVKEADHLARLLGTSRSQLFARAVASFIAAHRLRIETVNAELNLPTELPAENLPADKAA